MGKRLQTENQMVSAERILAYCKVDQEASLESTPEDKPNTDWPAKGNIKVLFTLFSISFEYI